MDHTLKKTSQMDTKFSLCIASPFPPPYGGMAVQAEKLALALEESGWLIYRVPINQPFGRHLSFLERGPGVRTLFRTLYFLHALGRCLNHSDTPLSIKWFLRLFSLGERTRNPSGQSAPKTDYFERTRRSGRKIFPAPCGLGPAACGHARCGDHSLSLFKN